MKTTRYFIMAGEGANPSRRRTVGEYKSIVEAKEHIKKLLAPGKLNPHNPYTGKRHRQTAYRDALSGSGIHNPRIVKREVYR